MSFVQKVENSIHIVHKVVHTGLIKVSLNLCKSRYNHLAKGNSNKRLIHKDGGYLHDPVLGADVSDI